MPAVMWRGPAWRLVRALGWLTLDAERLRWSPVVPTPFFAPIDVTAAEIRSVKVGGIFVGPDLRIDTAGNTYRFTVWRRGVLRAWAAHIRASPQAPGGVDGTDPVPDLE